MRQQDLGQILPASSTEWPPLAFANDPSIIVPHRRHCRTLGLRDPYVPSNGKENIPLFSNILSRPKTTWLYWRYYFTQFTQGIGYARDQPSVLWNPGRATSLETVGDLMKHIFPWLRQSSPGVLLCAHCVCSP